MGWSNKKNLYLFWDWRIGTDTDCAGCRRVEKTVQYEEHTHTATVRVVCVCVPDTWQGQGRCVPAPCCRSMEFLFSVPLCVFTFVNPSFFLSTSSTTSVRANTSILREMICRCPVFFDMLLLYYWYFIPGSIFWRELLIASFSLPRLRNAHLGQITIYR